MQNELAIAARFFTLRLTVAPDVDPTPATAAQLEILAPLIGDRVYENLAAEDATGLYVLFDYIGGADDYVAQGQIRMFSSAVYAVRVVEVFRGSVSDEAELAAAAMDELLQTARRVQWNDLDYYFICYRNKPFRRFASDPSDSAKRSIEIGGEFTLEIHVLD